MTPQFLLPSSGSLRCALRAGAVALVIGSGLLLQACGSSHPATSGDLRTESDKTDLDRRAAVRLELAGGYFSRGQYSTALDEIKLAMNLKPEMREAINMRNLVYAAMGETAMAEEGFRRAIASGPQDADSLHNYAWFLCQQGRMAPATSYFEQALAVPGYKGQARTLLARGICEARAGMLDRAERSLSRAFELEPGNPGVQLNLAEVLYRQQTYERARFYVRRINAQPDQVNAASLWLELRIERKLGNGATADELGQQLRRRFADAPQTQSLKDGRFDE